MKWAAGGIAVLAACGYAIAALNDSCIETKYSGGRLIQCESTEIFQPMHGADDGGRSTAAGVASIPLPSTVMGFLGAVLHRGCETTHVVEGKWTVCDDGFSLLERGRAPVAWMLRLKPDEDPVAKAERQAAAARAEIDLPVEDSDCGPFPCSAYLRNDEDPERNAYLRSLSEHEIARLGALLRAWEDQEVTRELEQARTDNTAVQARMKEIVAHEAALERMETVARIER